MKSAIKHISKVGLWGGGLLISLNLWAPVQIFADTNSRPGQEMAKNTAICKSLNTVSSKLIANFDSKKEGVAKSRNQTTEQTQKQREEQLQNLKEKRQEWDKKLEENQTKLEEKATTDEQRAAVEAYFAAVKAAIAVRRQAFDEAITAFKTGVQAAKESRKTQADSNLGNLKIAIEAAINKAKDACAQPDAEGQAILDQLRSDIKVAQQNFKSTRQTDDKLKDQMKPLIEALKTSHQTAQQQFKEAMDKARADLKAAFGDQAI